MEALRVLEQKVADLIDIVRRTREENIRLTEEIAELKTSLATYASDDQRRSQLAQETALTMSVVDGLIERINALSESECRQ